MLKLLVIADDFTGALDTGIQFRGEGTVLRFGRQEASFFENLDPATDVMIIDAETRHLSAEEAYNIVHKIVSDAMAYGCECVFKKTDSGLRGNIGAELAAALDASGRRMLHFVPAFPKLDRITKSGVHYIKGKPVADSVFGVDPFEPVRHSDICQIISAQTDIPVSRSNYGADEGILVYDASFQEELEIIAKNLQARDELHVISGCAGFAAALPGLLGLKKPEIPLPKLAPRFLTVCGSVNAITLEQMTVAEKAGVPRVRLSVPQKLDDSWIGTQKYEEDLNGWLDMVNARASSIIECDGKGNAMELELIREKLGMNLEAMRQTISHTMGRILKDLIDKGMEATMMVTGGDTLMAFMETAGLNEMVPIREYTPGVVLAQVTYRGKHYHLLSKSGGFGSPDLLETLEARILKDSK